MTLNLIIPSMPNFSCDGDDLVKQEDYFLFSFSDYISCAKTVQYKCFQD